LHTYQIHSLFHPEKILAKKYFKHTPYKYDSFEIMDVIQHGKDRYTKNPPAEEREEIIKVYDAGIYTFDYRFGRFIGFLKVKNLYTSSLIILLSDHGEEFMDHGGWEHGHTLYNELIKIPLIIKFPGNQWAGMEVDKVVSLVDILPTVLELNCIKYKNKRNLKIKHHGISLLDIINQPGAAEKRKVISYIAPYACSRTPMKTAIISRKFKFVYNKKFKDDDLKYFLTPPPPFSNCELYDLLKDSLEKTNIKHKNRSQFHKMLRIILTLKYKKNKKAFPERLRDDLKQLGYID
jgi:arylsulfatase A-like enzyme